MTQIKHALVLLLLVLPMFALAPSMVASPNEALMSPTKADTSLPAAFVEETLRVAVYVENNVSLPAYAEGGVYTNHSGNVISFLQGQGYAVTPVTTQDILDHKLLAAKYDVFVLPNQIPKENIINLVKDYWLSGGGILSIGGSIGYLLYMGMIHPSLEGDFGYIGVGPSPYFWYDYPYQNFTIEERNSVNQAYEVGDIIEYTETATVWNWPDLGTLLGNSLTILGIEVSGSYENGAIFSLDFDYQGGKIVQIPGNCSTIPVWERSIITDAVDWLAPRPKARIAFDFTHKPYYGVDAWDTNVSNVPRYNIWRDFLVNHSFVCDKLYPTGSNLTTADLAPFDVLIISLPNLNYSIAEVNLIRTWVEGGKGLFYLADFESINTLGQARMNELLLPWDITVLTGPNAGTFVTSDFTAHPTLEGITDISIAAGEWLNVTGNAYPIINQSTNVEIAASEPSLGRVVVSGDINWIDFTHYMNSDNLQFAINIINWLSSATAKVLVYADTNANSLSPNIVPLNGPVAQALNDLGIEFYLTSSIFYFNMSLFRNNWDMVVYDNINFYTGSYQPHLIDFVAAGGKLILSTYSLVSTVGDYFGAKVGSYISSPTSILITAPTHPIFNKPAPYGSSFVNTTLDLGFSTDAVNLTTYANASKLAGYTDYTGASITLGVGGKVIVNGALLTIYNDDTDESTYPDNVEIWENEIAYLYYDRPLVNHPDDVTYMETETGNEITWAPVADAGPWEYIVRENGSIIDSGRWYGGSITIDIDGVNASITEYQLTVYDRLGYSASDLVNLNVTEYVAPTTTGGGTPIDPTLLLIIGGVIAGVVIILIVIMQLKKKK